MLPAIPLWLAACGALVPPALKWWWGRSLAGRADDPLLPERLQALRRRTAGAFMTAGVLLFLISPAAAAALVTLMAFAHAAAGYPLRRALYEETWSLGACVWFFTRLVVSVFGLWILLAATPWIVEAAGEHQRGVAASLASVLVVWNWQSSFVIRRLMRARPVEDAALRARFDALAALTSVPRPRFEHVPMNGGMVVNAVALPSLGKPGILFTDALLSRLTLDESAAICAHELAHLEYYDRRRLLRHHAATVALILGAAALGLLTRDTFGSYTPMALMVWPLIMAVALALRARHRQENETASDLRAVTLTGNAGALATALTKLHAMARVPRRWDQQRERQASHPSLARRMRDIRAHAQTPQAAIEGATTFRSADGTMAATFESTHVSWQDAPGITHLLAYDALVELRLHVAGSGPPALVAVDRRHQRWQMTPPAADLAALQQVLDRVDGRLTRDASPPPRVSAFTGVGKVVGWIGALLAIQVVMSLFALGGAGLDGGGSLWRPFTIALFVILGTGLVGFPWLRRNPAKALRWGVAAIAIFAVLAVGSVMADLGRATTINRDMFAGQAAEPRMLGGAPAAVIELPFDVQALRLSPRGRLVAAVRRDGASGQTRGGRVFTVAGPRGVVADVEAEDVAFVDEAHLITLNVRDDGAEVSTLDVASGTRDWKLRIPAVRSGSLTYRGAGRGWIVTGRDASGRLVRATGIAGSTDVHESAWAAPADATAIDAWAANGAGTVSVLNHADAHAFARIWIAPASSTPVATVMPNTICVADAAVDRRLLCSTESGNATRVVAVDAETGAWFNVMTVNGPFRPGEQTAPGWLTGWWRSTPAALRLATADLLLASSPIDDDAPSMLGVSDTMLATVTSNAAGARVRLFRLGQ